MDFGVPPPPVNLDSKRTGKHNENFEGKQTAKQQPSKTHTRALKTKFSEATQGKANLQS